MDIAASAQANFNNTAATTNLDTWQNAAGNDLEINENHQIAGYASGAQDSGSSGGSGSGDTFNTADQTTALSGINLETSNFSFEYEDSLLSNATDNSTANNTDNSTHSSTDTNTNQTAAAQTATQHNPTSAHHSSSNAQGNVYVEITQIQEGTTPGQADKGSNNSHDTNSQSQDESFINTGSSLPDSYVSPAVFTPSTVRTQTLDVDLGNYERSDRLWDRGVKTLGLEDALQTDVNHNDNQAMRIALQDQGLIDHRQQNQFTLLNDKTGAQAYFAAQSKTWGWVGSNREALRGDPGTTNGYLPAPEGASQEFKAAYDGLIQDQSVGEFVATLLSIGGDGRLGSHHNARHGLSACNRWLDKSRDGAAGNGQRAGEL
jgi:hypothetical protein